MTTLLTALRGLLTAVAMGVIVLGALSLSLIEALPLDVPTQPALETLPVSTSTGPAGSPGAQQPVASRTPQLPTTTPTSTACVSPNGWRSYQVQAGDTLQSLATRSGLSASALRTANCLPEGNLASGAMIFLPPVAAHTATLQPPQPTATATVQSTISDGTPTIPFVCVRPAAWVQYAAMAGDTIEVLSQKLSIPPEELRQANCLAPDAEVRARDTLWVPFLPETPQEKPPGQGTNAPAATSLPVEQASPTATSAAATITNTAAPTPQLTPVIIQVTVLPAS